MFSRPRPVSSPIHPQQRVASERSLAVAAAGYPSAGNRITVYIDGDEAFEAACAAIRRARTRVWMEVYIFEADSAGRLILAAMTRAARRGVDVLLLFDRLGSRRLDLRALAPLVEAGGRVGIFNPLLRHRLGRRLGSLRHRDHRKILIVDDVGFCGGRNLTTDYGGPGPERFYDVTLCLEGPAVQALATLLLDTFARVTGERRALPPAPLARNGGLGATVLPLDARAGVQALDESVVAMVGAARSRCYVATPYFVPPAPILETLLAAAGRGVDLRVLTAGLSDIPLARVAGRHLYTRLLAAGARVYEMQYPTLHAKYLVIDDRHSLVGSYNFDVQGSRYNLEVGVAMDDATLAERLRVDFFSNLERSVEVTAASWRGRSVWARLAHWLAFRLAYL